MLEIVEPLSQALRAPALAGSDVRMNPVTAKAVADTLDHVASYCDRQAKLLDDANDIIKQSKPAVARWATWEETKAALFPVVRLVALVAVIGALIHVFG